MKMKGRRTTRSVVEIKGDEVAVTFYTTTERGTPVMLGAVRGKRADLLDLITTAPEVITAKKPL